MAESEFADAVTTAYLMPGYTTTLGSGGDTVVVTWPGVGTFNPALFTFLTGAQADPGVNGSSCIVVSGHDAYPYPGAGAAVWADGVSPQALGYVAADVRLAGSLTLEFGHCGVGCLFSQNDLTPGNGAKGYLLVMDNFTPGRRVLLLQMTNGVSGSPGAATTTEDPHTYVVLAATAIDFFTIGVAYQMKLEWYVDAVNLKGVFLRARFAGSILWTIVYTGAGAYIPAVAAHAKYGVVGMQKTNPTIMYFDHVLTGTGDGA